MQGVYANLLQMETSTHCVDCAAKWANSAHKHLLTEIQGPNELIDHYYLLIYFSVLLLFTHRTGHFHNV